MGNLFRSSGCCNNDGDILWFLILFLLLFWNGYGCSNNNCCRNLSNNDCGCDN